MISVASMFGPSPDWVVGVSKLNLCRKDCSWTKSEIIDLYPWDAGTDNGISYMSPNSETTPREKMKPITTLYPEDPRSPFYDPSGRPMLPLARLYLTREKIIPRGCDEEVLQQQVAQLEVAENTEDTVRRIVQSKSSNRFVAVSFAHSLNSNLFPHSRVSDHGVHDMVELLGELWQRIENAYQIVLDAREGSHVQVQQTIGLQGDVRLFDP